jgi:hypothetical protein
MIPTAMHVVGDGEDGMRVAAWEVVWSQQLPLPLFPLAAAKSMVLAANHRHEQI